ncbi:thymidylate synthase [Marinobacterium sedimentorum]|uniref:thymidylate synthase n=1 Tax=Marinobacterium sedimentorum TaxID=2927804 RepID=UPI0020C73CC9|nr:thymidylate synthase [Marinobacterium sedimentorum]MCP8687285.1 thymidylate synthase [Marinobacterium sedimentorum]
MFIRQKTLDDLLFDVFSKLLKSKNPVKATRGSTFELFGVILELSNPRARLSRTETKGTIFSCLGELLWYISGSNDLSFIKHYIKRYEDDSEDGKTIYGAYGPRLLKQDGHINQIKNVIEILSLKETSRRAVIQIFDSSDIDSYHKEIPCTCNLQFIVRKGKLNMLTHMRSNDAFFGLPHDIFSFTMLQEIIARSLNIEVGIYKHSVGSLHIYENYVEKAKQFIDEGFQSSKPMPSMPIGDPKKSIEKLLKVEQNIRSKNICYDGSEELEPYWTDLALLLSIFNISKQIDNDHSTEIERLKNLISSDTYKIYIEKRQQSFTKAKIPVQLPLDNRKNNSKCSHE